MVTVPKLWPGRTVACVAPGPSLVRADVAQLLGRVPIIAINDAWGLVPEADVLYSSDEYWFPRHKGVPAFAGRKYAVLPNGNAYNPFEAYPAIEVLRNTGFEGLEIDPTGLRTGKNSGYAAINLAVHFGAARVLLLGYDMRLGPREREFPFRRRPHFDESRTSLRAWHFSYWRPFYETIRAPLAAAGIEVLNCTPRSALTVFPHVPLETALAAIEVAA